VWGSSHGVSLLCCQHIEVLIAPSCLWFLVPVQRSHFALGSYRSGCFVYFPFCFCSNGLLFPFLSVRPARYHARKVLFFFWAGSQVRSVFFVALKSGVCLAVTLDLIFPHVYVLVSHQSSFRSVFFSPGVLAFNARGSFGFLSTVSI
jgi:hypothetical protein